MNEPTKLEVVAVESNESALLVPPATIRTRFVSRTVAARNALRKIAEAIRGAAERVRVFFMKLFVRYFVSISSKSKCPACGVRKEHTIVWHEVLNVILHRCGRCSAHWAESALVKVEAWKLKQPAEELEPQTAVPKKELKRA